MQTRKACKYLFPDTLGEALAAATCFIGALHEKKSKCYKHKTVTKPCKCKLSERPN